MKRRNRRITNHRIAGRYCCTAGAQYNLARHHRFILRFTLLLAFMGILLPVSLAREPARKLRIARSLKPTTTAARVAAAHNIAKAPSWHPPHKVKIWTAGCLGRTFRVTQLPNCQHLETLISYDPSGETLGKAKRRLGGVSACTGSFHNPRSFALADFLQREGAIVSGAKTGRSFLAIYPDGKLDISGDYSLVKRQPGVSAIALGQRLIPFQMDGFSKGFMNRTTDRMAIGLNKNFIYIVQGRSDVWKLAHFMKYKIPVNTAINSDGGHVVRGRAPVHIVFRWNKDKSPVPVLAESRYGTGRKGT